MDKVRTATEKTVNTAGKVVKVAGLIVAVGETVLNAMGNSKKK